MLGCSTAGEILGEEVHDGCAAITAVRFEHSQVRQADVSFEEGEGTVLHMLSHLYLQRTETRNLQDAKPAQAYFLEDLKLSKNMSDVYARAAEGLSASEMRSSLGTARFSQGIVRVHHLKAHGRCQIRGRVLSHFRRL